MKRLLYTLITAAFLVTLGNPATAQPRPRYQERGDDHYNRFGRGTLDRVRADLGHAERNLHYIAPPEMQRFLNVREGLAGFQRAWERGRYNRADLDQAIVNLQILVDRARLHPRDRDMLAGDLNQLRDMRERIERGPRRY
jgi:hypothetical protein